MGRVRAWLGRPGIDLDTLDRATRDQYGHPSGMLWCTTCQRGAQVVDVKWSLEADRYTGQWLAYWLCPDPCPGENAMWAPPGSWIRRQVDDVLAVRRVVDAGWAVAEAGLYAAPVVLGVLLVGHAVVSAIGGLL